jgi:hypothetical protein
MLLENIRLQGSHILEVKEEANGQQVDILLDSPSDVESSLLEKKVLRLKEVILYTKKEVPFSGEPVIRSVKVLHSPGQAQRAFSGATTANYKIEIITNAGSRVLEFADWTWFDAYAGPPRGLEVKEARPVKVELGFY